MAHQSCQQLGETQQYRLARPIHIHLIRAEGGPDRDQTVGGLQWREQG